MNYENVKWMKELMFKTIPDEGIEHDEVLLAIEQLKMEVISWFASDLAHDAISERRN